MIINLYTICWMIIYFNPIQKLINNIFLKLPQNLLTESLWTILGCQKCLTFWVVLLFTLNPIVAIICSMVAQIQTRIIK